MARESFVMVVAARECWMPIVQNQGADTEGLEEEATRWTTKWDFSDMVPPKARDIQEVLRRARRTSPGPEGTPYALWKQAG